MFVPSAVHSFLASLGFAAFARDRRRAHHRSVRTRARFRLEGLEERRLLSGISGITEFPIPAPASALSGITAGPDGNLWFTDRGDNAIGMINPTTHAISLYAIPTAGAWPFGIAAGSDGNLWFTEAFANKVGEINPTTHAITEFALPAVSNGGNGIAYPRGITAGPDSNLWFAWEGTGAGAIGEINPTTHAINYYPLSSTLWHTTAITAGPDGNLWFTTQNGLDGYIGEINPTTHAISAFAAPTDPGLAATITSGADGNLWFTIEASSDIGMINTTTHAITEHSFPAGSVGITSGPEGNLWSTEPSAGALAGINPTTDVVTESSVPYSGSGPSAITTGPDGNLWFTDDDNAIGVATLTTSQLVVTKQPPASITAGSPFGLTVEAEDSSGNLLSSFNGTVTLAMANNPGGGTLGGALTTTASNGVAIFSGLALTKAASGYTLYTSGGGFGWGVTNAISVIPAAATQLVITQQPPASAKVSSAFGLQACIEDAYGNVVTTANNTVSVAFANNQTGATLGGTRSVTASQGVATFSSLTINQVGSGYTLAASSSGLTAAVTNPITVTSKKTTSNAVIAPATAVAPDPLLAPLVLDSPRFLDSLDLKKRARQ